MAFEMIHLDGFDSYSAIGDVSDRWEQYSSGSSLLATSGRGGGKCYQKGGATSPLENGTYSLRLNTIDTYRCLIVGAAINFRVYANSNAEGSTGLIQLHSIHGVTSTQVTVSLTTDGYLKVYRGNPSTGTALATGTTKLQPYTWYYIEFKVFIDDSSGAYELKIDESTEVSGSTVDTKNQTQNYVSSVCFHPIDEPSASLTMDYYIDDVYVKGDPTTNTAGGFEGDVRVTHYAPDADGTNSAWTSTEGDDHSAIDDASPDGTTYLSSSTAAQKFSVGHENFTATGTGAIVGVSQTFHMLTPDGPTRNVKPLCRSGGTDYSQTAVRALDGRNQSHIYEVDPNTSSDWTAANLNSAEFGLELV